MTFIPYTKESVSMYLKEKKPNMIYMAPDVYMKFEFHEIMVLFNGIVESLADKWTDQLQLWNTSLDGRKDENDNEIKEMGQQFQSVDFSVIQTIEQEDINQIQHSELAFVFNRERKIFVNIEFLNALNSAGSNYIWYDSIA